MPACREKLVVPGLQDCPAGCGPMLHNLARIDRHKSRRYIMPSGQGLLAQIVEELLLQHPFSRSGLTLLTIPLGRYLCAGRARVIPPPTVCDEALAMSLPIAVCEI